MESASADLQVFAEVAVAFAGFSALVSVIGRRPGGDDPRADSLRLRILVETALIVVVFSLLPIALAKFPLSELAVWRISSSVFILTGAIGSVINARRLRGQSSLMTLADRITLWLAWPLDIGQFSFLIVVASGFWPDQSSAFYFAALYANLVMSALMFMRVAGSVLSQTEE